MSNVSALAAPRPLPELARARASWFFGEWEELASIDPKLLAAHPERGRMALLVATAQQQLGQADAAARSARLAIAWGCNTKLVAQVLIAGVHNTLGRAAALAGRAPQAAVHFRSAVAVGDGGGGADELMGHARSVREMTKLGLLEQAAAIMDDSLAQAARREQRPSHADARLKVLEAQFELLRGSLSLAAQRGQLVTETAAQDWRQSATSQLGQDLWVLEQTRYKRGGFFVEFGACDGVLLSNTHLLERRFGWTGICAEPHPRFFGQLKANRSCQVSDACVAGHSGRQVDFILADEYGGMAEFAATDVHADKREAFLALGKVMQVSTVSLHDLLTRHGAPHDIDYLSIDTEGSEYEILRNFPFDRWRIRCITVEHNFSASRELIRGLLEPLGYRRQEAQWDDWYVLPDPPNTAG